jgi:heterodisulfide reductase subunit A-like polyferredoxin
VNGPPPPADYDVLVLGAGVGGMESALTLGDMGFRVLLVEKEPSVGGRMILLSKVFPTLDCASCISTPKMAAVNNHPNVRSLVYSEVEEIAPNGDGRFRVRVTRKPTFVDFAKCTGCALCEPVCPVPVPDEFNYDLASRRAAHIAFPQAVPKKAILSRRGSSPCNFRCPAGVKPHGYIALVREGKYDEAFRQHLEDAPLVGVLSRACYAPCEEGCTRAELEGPVSIRGIKRFMADRYYAAHSAPEYGPPAVSSGHRVAVVGSGPSGLTAAFFLARRGHSVTVLEADQAPGGMLRWGIPAYRLPRSVLERDLRNITALGVEIRANAPVRSLAHLREEGFEAVYLATGTVGGRRLDVPGEELAGVYDSVAFLHAINDGAPPDLAHRRVAVVGGGNVAIDCARSALRLGAKEVRIVYRRTREEMPAHAAEIQDAEEEGIRLDCSWVPDRVLGYDGKVWALSLVGSRSTGGKGRSHALTLDERRRWELPVDVVISAIGLVPATSPFATEIARAADGTVAVEGETLRASLPYVFAGGDDVLGPSSIAEAMGQGRRAAESIDRYLNGQPLRPTRGEVPLPEVDRRAVAAEARTAADARNGVPIPRSAVDERVRTFADYEGGFSEEEARASALRCLDCGLCSECRQCVAACPADAIDLGMRAETETVVVRSVALATGFSPFDARQKPAFGFGRYANVITGPQMDRILAPTRPYNAVVRPSDGKTPSNVAFVLCTGSRDEQVGNRLCSRVCCMYSMKQAQLLMGALPVSDVTIYYIDLRAFGKGYEEFLQQTKGMGVYFTKGKVSRIEEVEDGDLLVQYDDLENGGGQKTARHDLVVLATGLLPNVGALRLFPQGAPAQDAYSYVREPDEELEPGATSLDGVFVIGSATAVRDIPDTIVHAEAASAQIAAYLKRPEAEA